MPTTTRKLIRQKAIEKLYSPRFPTASTTTAAGTTTTLIDSILAPASQSEDYVQAWILFTEGANDGLISRVTNVDFTGSTSSLTFAPARTATASGDDYELHYKFYPNFVNNKINEILENLRRPIYIPLTLIADGDMEASGTTDWTASNATLVKDTINVLRGRRSLSVTAFADSGQARSASVNVPPNTPVYVEVTCFITSGDQAKLILRDVTNGADIETAQSDVTGWVTLKFTATTPATAEVVQVWLEAVNNTDIVFFNSAVLLLPNQKEYTYPSTLEWSEDFDTIFHYPNMSSIGTTFSEMAYRTLESRPVAWPGAGMERDETAVVPYRITLPDRPITHALYVGGRVDYATLSTEAATTTAPEDIMVDLLYAELLDQWAQDDNDDDNFQGALARQAKALQVRKNLLPRMLEFAPQKAKVLGARRN